MEFQLLASMKKTLVGIGISQSCRISLVDSRKRSSQACHHSQSARTLTSLPLLKSWELALGKLKGGKAGGRMGILPEMNLNRGDELWNRLHQLLLKVWRKHPIVADWQDVQIVPIPKKGDNWRGIAS